MRSLTSRRCILLAAAICMVAAATVQAQERPSNNDERLARFLKRFPQADANKDGVLTMQEARQFYRDRGTISDKEWSAYMTTLASAI